MDFELGKSYHQLKIGEKASFTKTITETDVYLFAGISGDFNPMHVNEEFAKKTPFKTRIAHGALPQSLIAPVLGMKLPGLGTIAVEISCRFKAPVFFGDTITAYGPHRGEDRKKAMGAHGTHLDESAWKINCGRRGGGYTASRSPSAIIWQRGKYEPRDN